LAARLRARRAARSLGLILGARTVRIARAGRRRDPSVGACRPRAGALGPIPGTEPAPPGAGVTSGAVGFRCAIATGWEDCSLS